MSNHSLSAMLSFIVALSLIVASQLFKEHLASSRSGTLMAGCVGGLEFLFLLTGISNLEMSNGGSSVRAGWPEVVMSLLLALLSSALIHRVAVTVCTLSSFTLLFFVIGISHNSYQVSSVAQATTNKKKK